MNQPSITTSKTQIFEQTSDEKAVTIIIASTGLGRSHSSVFDTSNAESINSHIEVLRLTGYNSIRTIETAL